MIPYASYVIVNMNNVETDCTTLQLNCHYLRRKLGSRKSHDFLLLDKVWVTTELLNVSPRLCMSKKKCHSTEGCYMFVAEQGCKAAVSGPKVCKESR